MGLMDKMVGKDDPKHPMYEELADTPWITRNRNLNDKTWKNLNRDWNSVNVMDDAIRGQLNSVVDDWYNRSKSDFERSYNQTMNKQLARDYNRFGTTGGTSSLLTRDNYNLMKQRELADLASNRSDRYNNLINQELQRRYNWLNQNYKGWQDSGQTTQAMDVANWQIRNLNKDQAYKNQIQEYNNNWFHNLNQLGATVGQAFATYWGGPIGNMLAGQANNVLAGDYNPNGTYSMDSPLNMFSNGNQNGNYNSIASQLGQMGSNWFTSRQGNSNTTGSLYNNFNNSLNNTDSNRLNYWASNYPLMNTRNNIGDFYNALVGLG